MFRKKQQTTPITVFAEELANVEWAGQVTVDNTGTVALMRIDHIAPEEMAKALTAAAARINR